MSGFNSDFQDSEGGEQVKARLKWFNATKGFGFVSPVDGTADAFLHVSVLQRAGLQDIGEQAELLCEVGPGPKGPQVIRIVEVISAGEPALSSGQGGDSGYGYQSAPRYDAPRQDSQPNNFGARIDDGQGDQPTMDGAEEKMSGVVKWFKVDKGFGFITTEGSGSDVFIHKSVLMKSGLYSLEAGQRVRMSVQDVQKGREATWVAAE